MKHVRHMTILVLIAVLSVPTVFAQQETVVTGTITDARTGDPLPGANVLIELTNLGAASGLNGNYTFKVPARAVQGQEVKLTAQFIGYRPHTERIVLVEGTITQDFALNEDVLEMDAIIVTGVVDETPKTKSPLSTAHLGPEALERVPSGSPETALYGKVAGVRVIRGLGQPGTSASVLLRTPTSINASGRSQDPLYIVDGVIVDPSVTGSPLTDIPSEDIESMEVVKGAAGASIYGARAANGVIQISTKRGNYLGQNQTKIRLRTEFGTNALPKKLAVNKHHAYKQAETSYTDDNGVKVEPGDFIDGDGNFVDPRSVGGRISDTFKSGIEFYDNEYKYVATGEVGDPMEKLSGPFDQMDRFFDAGDYQSSTVSISRNMEKTNFMLSLGDRKESGVITGIDGLRRRSVRLNLDHKFRGTLDIGMTAMFSQSNRDLVDQDFAGFYAITFMAPDADLTKIDPETEKLYIQPDPTSVEDNPLYFVRYNDRDDLRRRVMSSFSLRWRPVDWFNVQTNLSYDRSDRNNELFWPIGYTSISPGPEVTGRYIKGSYYDQAVNGNVTASLIKSFGELVLKLKGRGLFERTEYNGASADGRDFAVKGVRSLGVSSQDARFIGSVKEEVRSNGYYFMGGVELKDRYIADFLLRHEGSSLFGPEERYRTYSRFSGAYRISEEPWWFLPMFNEFKLRGSFGTAGSRPNFYARFETWTVSGGVVSKGNLGNKQLKPEFAQETEIGLDATLMDRVSLELNYAKTDVDDQILYVPLPGYAGYGNQWRNAGKLETAIVEATVTASLARSRDFSWTAGLVFDKTLKQKIARLDVPAYRRGAFYIKEGEDLGAIYGDKFITDLGDLPKGIDKNEFNVNDDGFVVWVGADASYKDGISDSLWGTSGSLSDDYDVTHSYKWGIPIKFKEAEFKDGEFDKYNEFVKLGTTIPNFNFGINSTVRFKAVEIYALFDAQVGGNIYNNTNQWGLRELKLGEVDQFGKPDELKKPGLYYATLYNVNAVNSHFAEDATYFKLRELSVTYTFNRKALSGILGGALSKVSIGLVGRNLLTFTDYKGYDPEVGSTGFDLGSAVVARYDGFGYPNFRTISGVIEVEF